MNLIDDAWIPVMLDKGEEKLLSLNEIFIHGQDISDLAVPPPQRVALMRLLICIIQAAIGGPETVEDWRRCRECIASESLSYLQRWKSKFELRGDEPFMQILDLTVSDGNEKPLDMLDCRLSSGNNAVLFDQEASPKGRHFSESEIALNLITFLNFSTGGKVGQAEWHQKKYSESTFAAPCIKCAHAFIIGDTLLDTLFLNLLCKNDDFGVNTLPNGEWGKPIWEHFPKNVNDFNSFENAGRTYLGRLVPLSRFIKLLSNDRCIIGPTHKTYKIEHLPIHREPSTIVKISAKKGDFYYLPLSSEKHMWRELSAILGLKASDNASFGESGALALGKFLKEVSVLPNDHIEIWVGGLETGAQAAKLSDLLEWRFRIPRELLDTSRLLQYENGVTLAEKAEWALVESVKVCYKDLGMDAKITPTAEAKTAYWSRLDRSYSVLFETAKDGHTSLSEKWYPIVRNAMDQAYRQTCPQNTSRQIQAFAKGLQRLRLKKTD